MSLLNKNIEAALEALDTSDENKKILQDILYKEHLYKERDWDSTAPNEISQLLREHISGENEE